MTIKEFLYLCNDYDGGEEGFVDIISKFVNLEKGDVQWLVDEFKLLAPRTIQDWGCGYTCPVGNVRSRVVRAIRNKYHRIM